MAGSYAREGDQTTGHGSFAPSIFLPGSSLCQLAQIEGKPMLTVDVIVASHGSPSPSPPIVDGKIIEGSPTSFVTCDDGVKRKVARIGDALSCGCKIVGGAKTVGAGANA